MADNEYHSYTNKYGETKTTDSYGNTYYSAKNPYGGTTTTDAYGNRWETTTGLSGQTVTRQTQYGYDHNSATSYRIPPVHYVDHQGKGKVIATSYFKAQENRKFQLILWLLQIITVILLPKKPLYFFLVMTAISVIRTYLTMEGDIIGGYFGFCFAALFYILVGVLYHFRYSLYEEFGIGSKIPILLFAVGAAKLLVLIVERIAEKNLENKIEADTRAGYSWTKFDDEKMKKEGIRTYEQYRGLMAAEKEKKDLAKKQEEQKQADEKRRVEEEYSRMIPGCWKYYIDPIAPKSFGPMILLKEDKSGKIIYPDRTEKEIEWRFEYDIARRMYADNKKIFITERDSKAIHCFAEAMRNSNDPHHAFHYIGCQNGRDLYKRQVLLFQKEQVETKAYMQARQPKKQNGIPQSVFAVSSCTYVGHKDLYLKGKMIYGTFELSEMVRLAIFDESTLEKSSKAVNIDEIRIMKNGDLQNVPAISQGQEGGLVFRGIGMPYGSEEGVFKVSGRIYGEPVKFFQRTVISEDNSANKPVSSGATFHVWSADDNNQEEWHLKGVLGSGTVNVGDTILIPNKLGDIFEGKISGIKTIKKGIELQSLASPSDQSIMLTIRGVPSNIRKQANIKSRGVNIKG